MLRTCTREEFDRYFEFVYALACDPTRSGYPSYSDGIKTKAMFLERAEKAFSRDTEEILLFEYDGAVEGWIHYYALPEDNYLSTVSCNLAAHTEAALEEFVALMRRRFAGYELYLGFAKDNADAVSYLATHGFSCIEDNFNNTFYFDRTPLAPRVGDTVRITAENYEWFAALHRQKESEMYWNSERIRDTLDEWLVLAERQEDVTVGAVYVRLDDDGWFEIFGIDLLSDTFDPALFEALLSAALHEAAALGAKYMTFFCNTEEEPLALRLGFTPVGEYVCYYTRLA